MGLLALAAAIALPAPAPAQGVPVPMGTARRLLTAPIDADHWVRLAGNTRPEADAQHDLGRVPDALPLAHLQLLLKRPAERETGLAQFVDSLHDRRSRDYHRWLSAARFGERFGLAAADVATLRAWLTQQGFTVNSVSPSTLVIDFSGNAGQVAAAFHTEIHYLAAGGARHMANMSDPAIPAALAPAVAGIVSLHDFRPRALHRVRTRYSVGGGTQLVAPADLATIYGLAPLFAQGRTGNGQAVVVIEDSDVFDSADWTTFRSTFGLAGYTSGSFTQVHPAPASGANNCADPGVVANADDEATLDAEWASAAAPGAAIVLAACADTATSFGGLIALQNLVGSASPPAIVSLSYGECEAANGATANLAFSTLYQQAVAEGTSVFVAAGDEAAASCDSQAAYATHGIGVNGFASTAYNVAVGGTDFADTYAGSSGSYWSTSNGAYYGSALAYVPEIPWNDSCAGALLADFEGYDATYGSASFCNSSNGAAFLNVTAGGGGPSGCASGSPSLADVVGGTCAGTAKPAWQAGVAGIPGDGVRDLPDVSLFAGNGLWGHYYVYCFSNTAETGGKACNGAPSGWSGAGGTSFAAPILAGIQALVNQTLGTSQGNPNYVYYALAAAQAASGLGCGSTGTNGVASGCTFQDVIEGDMEVACGKLIVGRRTAGYEDCYDSSGTYGILSTSTTGYAAAYGAAAGWDFASGLGSVNAANLVAAWSGLGLALGGSATATANGLLSYALTVTNGGPQSASGIVLTATLPAGSTLSSAAGAVCAQSGQRLSCTLGTLTAGSKLSLTLLIAPNGTGSGALTFQVSGATGNVNLYAESITIAAASTADTASGDGPMPLWADAALALGIAGLAMRRLRAQPIERTTPPSTRSAAPEVAAAGTLHT